MKEFLEKGCQVVRGDSTMEGLNASHMMFMSSHHVHMVILCDQI